MFKRIAGVILLTLGLLGVSYELVPTSAPTQSSPFCATRPAGDSSNACASTAFVQGASAITFISCSASQFVIGIGNPSQCSALTNGVLPVGAANSLKGTLTGAAGSETDLGVPSCSGANQAIQYTSGTGFSCVTIAGTGGITSPTVRITLASGVPVMASSRAAQSTVYVTPYGGGNVPIYNGSTFTMTNFAEVSQATTDATKSPAAVANNSVYDIFCWVDTGPTNRCTRGPAWTNSSTRGYTLTTINGIPLNTSSITNGPGALLGTWVGTIASNGTATIDFIYGAVASGGTPAVFNVWNAYNRVMVGTIVTDNGTSYTYSSATLRQARASAGNQISFVLGAQEDSPTGNYIISVTVASTAGSFTQEAVGFDVTNASSVGSTIIQNETANATVTSPNVPFVWPQPAIGTHTLVAIEGADGTHSNTYGSTSIASAGNLSMQLRM